MLLYFGRKKRKSRYERKAILKDSHLMHQNRRKENLSPSKKKLSVQSIRAFLFAPLDGTLTVEAAIVVPLFLFFMIAVLQYGAVMETAVKFGTAMSETGKEMAVAAYIEKYGGETDRVTEITAAALSAVYAKNKVMQRSGDTSAVRNANMVFSSFLKKEEMIDLVLTYQIKTPIASISLPGNFFLQRAKVRAWTGRVPSGESEADGEGKTDSELVYVTETGSVYHDDPDCTHLKLSIRPIDLDKVQNVRNSGGEIYHACEKCGASASGTVYITNEGNRYHSSLTCSGLKRTVHQVSREEAENLPPCSKCGKGHTNCG